MDETRSNVKVLYHADCPDGWLAALAPAWETMGEVERIACKHGDPAPNLGQGSGLDRIVIVDFSFRPEQLVRWHRQGWRILLLDHHQTALEAFDSSDLVYLVEYEQFYDRHTFGLAPAALCAGLDEFMVQLEMSQSGASMAWNFSRATRPSIVDYTRDKDLWLFELPESETVAALINALPHTVEAWEPYLTMTANELIQAAKPVAALRDKVVNDLTAFHKVKRLSKPDGTFIAEFPIIENMPYVVSSAAIHKLMNDTDSDLAGYSRLVKDNDGNVMESYGLRSRGSQDGRARQIAEQFGGGGHPNAAGFRIPWML